MVSEASEGAATFVLLREKVRAVRSVRVIDGIVLGAQEALWNQLYKRSVLPLSEEDVCMITSNRQRRD